MTRLCFILGDQLSESLSSLSQIDKDRDVVFLCEVVEEATYVSHHPKKIAFLFSAMRHFAEHLKIRGYIYLTLDNGDQYIIDLKYIVGYKTTYPKQRDRR